MPDDWRTYGPPDWKPKPRVKEWVAKVVNSIAGYVILGIVYTVVQWYMSGLTLAERGREVRTDNEREARGWLDASPKHTQYIQPGATVVRPIDLARSYRDTTRGAEFAYSGQTVAIPIRDYIVRGREVHWHLGDIRTPAVVVMCLAEGAGVPAAAQNHRILWVTGQCHGRIEDGVEREFPGYGFHVRITHCRAVLE